MFNPAVREFLTPEMLAVDAVIRARLHSEVALVRQVAEYIIGSGGKRLRPVLVVLASGALGYRGTFHHQLAAVVEFIHTATLLHDDVVDESELRRGKPTAKVLFGNAASVLVGDFVYSRAFQMMVEVNNMRVMEVLAEATNIIAEGEVLQLMNCHDPDVKEAGYLQVVRYKTAKLFEAATRLGALLAGAGREQEEALANYGMHLGTAFQLVDDVLDYSGDQQTMGKNLGDDLAEGKTTLPLIYAMKHGNVEDAALIKTAIRDGGLEHIHEVIAAIERSDALAYTRRQARAEADFARASLVALPDSPQKEYLLQLAEFAVTRDY